MARRRPHTGPRGPRPQLSRELWEYRSGRRSYAQLSESAKWDCLVLPGDSKFWETVLQKVQAGEIEVVADLVHRIGDAPLLPGWTRGF
jgi:hypothetical protein